MNKLMISMLALTFVAGVASTESFAKQRKLPKITCVEKNATTIPMRESRRIYLELKEQHRLNEKTTVNGS
jgi:hypothetical protein